MAVPPDRCPCGFGLPYLDCCARSHSRSAPAATAEALMRSRFAAFVLGDVDYLLGSWHPSTRPARLSLDPGLRWTRLEIVATTDGTPFHTEGTVRFRAHYRADGTPGVHSEHSRFRREGGLWLYVDAIEETA